MGVRNNCGMPRTVRPDLPAEVEAAVSAFGNLVKVAVLRSLAIEGAATRSELAQRLGVTTSLLQKHLASLEASGVVGVVPARTEPGIRSRRYEMNRARVDQLISAITNGILVDPESQKPH